jgi:EAL domain-containing protein (putative c-di-GMP-specific phosphodiesterase class I)
MTAWETTIIADYPAGPAVGERDIGGRAPVATPQAKSDRAPYQSPGIIRPSGLPPERQRLLDDLRVALVAPDQLSLVYQPRVDLATGRCLAVEALLRWQHPTLGQVSPAAFIPVVEADPLIGQLTDWVLNTALSFGAQLEASGHDIQISANVSPANLVVGYFVGRLVELLRTHGMPTSRLELEFTEGALLGDDNRTRRQLNQIRRIGIGVSIDDFGAGYSNLGYLRHIPADIIKIDRSLVQNIDADEGSATITKWLIGLAHQLHLRVVAEGIETDPVRAMLAAWGCDEGQGYFISRPMAGSNLLAWMAERQPALA